MVSVAARPVRLCRPHHRRREPPRGGLAGLLYNELFDWAQTAGHDRLVCEVNLEPPNPGSDAFHTKMGFAEVGRAELEPGGKWVRYYEKLL